MRDLRKQLRPARGSDPNPLHADPPPLTGQPATQSDEERGTLTFELEQKDDGRWIAEFPQLPGVMCYGQTKDEAINNAKSLASEGIADRITNGEWPPSALPHR